MISQKKSLQRLLSYNDSPSPILSVYLSLPAHGKAFDTEVLKDNFRQLIGETVTGEGLERVFQNISYIDGFLDTYRPRTQDKSLAVFSGGETLFEEIRLAIDIQDCLVIDHSPYIKPLIQMNGEERYLVILADRKRAQLITLNSGMLEQRKEIEDEDAVPPDIQGRWVNSPRGQRNDRIQRHIQQHERRYYDDLAQKIQSFIGNKSLKGIILAGHKGEMHRLTSFLPESMQQKVIGNFTSEMKTNVNEILNKSREVINRAVSRQETMTAPLSI